jgi:hypothetical protein
MKRFLSLIVAALFFAGCGGNSSMSETAESTGITPSVTAKLSARDLGPLRLSSKTLGPGDSWTREYLRPWIDHHLVVKNTSSKVISVTNAAAEKEFDNRSLVIMYGCAMGSNGPQAPVTRACFADPNQSRIQPGESADLTVRVYRGLVGMGTFAPGTYRYDFDLLYVEDPDIVWSKDNDGAWDRAKISVEYDMRNS